MDSEEIAFREMFPLVIGALVLLTLVFIIIGVLLGDSEDVYVPSGMTRAEVLAERVEPIGRVQMGGPEVVAVADEPDDPAEPRSGDAVYGAACAACHDTGAAGSPLLDDAGEWQARLDERGFDGLLQSVIDGMGAMPPRGGSDASDDELHLSVEYILEEAGVSW